MSKLNTRAKYWIIGGTLLFGVHLFYHQIIAKMYKVEVLSTVNPKWWFQQYCKFLTCSLMNYIASINIISLISLINNSIVLSFNCPINSLLILLHNPIFNLLPWRRLAFFLHLLWVHWHLLSSLSNHLHPITSLLRSKLSNLQLWLSAEKHALINGLVGQPKL